MKDIDQILQRLKKGNENYCADRVRQETADQKRREQLVAEGQRGHAFATIVTCADSRVPPELIFDCGLGDLFVIRSAGNACYSREVLSSIEIGVLYVHTPVVVVMGHSGCGAIQTALDINSIEGAADLAIPNTRFFVDKMRAELELAKGHHISLEDENALQALKRIRQRCPDVAKMERSGQIRLVAAMYNMADGKVRWLEELDSEGPVEVPDNYPYDHMRR